MRDVFHENRGVVVHYMRAALARGPTTPRRPIAGPLRSMSKIWQYENLMAMRRAV
jgi:hypothetical protein